MQASCTACHNVLHHFLLMVVCPYSHMGGGGGGSFHNNSKSNDQKKKSDSCKVICIADFLGFPRNFGGAITLLVPWQLHVDHMTNLH